MMAKRSAAVPRTLREEIRAALGLGEGRERLGGDQVVVVDGWCSVAERLPPLGESGVVGITGAARPRVLGIVEISVVRARDDGCQVAVDNLVDVLARSVLVVMEHVEHGDAVGLSVDGRLVVDDRQVLSRLLPGLRAREAFREVLAGHLAAEPGGALRLDVDGPEQARGELPAEDGDWQVERRAAAVKEVRALLHRGVRVGDAAPCRGGPRRGSCRARGDGAFGLAPTKVPSSLMGTKESSPITVMPAVVVFCWRPPVPPAPRAGMSRPPSGDVGIGGGGSGDPAEVKRASW